MFVHIPSLLRNFSFLSDSLTLRWSQFPPGTFHTEKSDLCLPETKDYIYSWSLDQRVLTIMPRVQLKAKPHLFTLWNFCRWNSNEILFFGYPNQIWSLHNSFLSYPNPILSLTGVFLSYANPNRKAECKIMGLGPTNILCILRDNQVSCIHWVYRLYWFKLCANKI